ALAIANHDQCRKAEALAALHRLGNAVDVHQLLDQFLAAIVVTAATTTTLIAPSPAAITTAASAAPPATTAACLAGRALLGRVARSLRLRLSSHRRLHAGSWSRTGVVD